MHIEMKSAVVGAVLGGIFGLAGGVLASDNPPFWLEPIIQAWSDPKNNWATNDEYVSLYSRQYEKGFYPINVKGKLVNGSERYRAEWRAFHPVPFAFDTRSNLNRKNFDEKDQCFRAVGYNLESSSQFEKASGETVFLATWICLKTECTQANRTC